MKIKKDDNIIVISGKDKGKKGKIVKVFPKENLVLVEGMNIKKRHQRSRQGGKPGQVIEKSAPMPVSNVMILDPKTGKGTRVAIKREKGKRVRVAQKSGTEI